MDEPMTEEQRPVRGVVEVFIAFEMTACTKREQYSSLVSDQLD